MSLSGSWDSRWRSWATIRLATWSSTALPRKTIRSLSRREKMSNSRSPRAVRSITIGTRGMAPESRTLGQDGFAAVLPQAPEQALDPAADVAPVQAQRVGGVRGRRAVGEHRQEREVLGLDRVGGGVQVL